MSNTPDDLDAVADVEDALALLAPLAEGEAETAPASVRDAVLVHARRAPQPVAEPVDPAALYRRRAADLADVVTSLEPEAWQLPAAPYAWSVHGLIAHLLVIERYTAAQLGLGPVPDGDPLDHLGLGPDTVVAELGDDPLATAGRWRQTAQRVAEHVSDASFDLDAPLPLHQWPFSAAAALVVRSFELWTHADDIRRATGRPTAAPAPGELRTMSATSVRSLPLALGLVAPDVEMAPTRVVLTGPGGGTFDLAAGTSSDRTIVVADVVDYCRLVARRIPPGELDCDVEGDGRLARALLDAASVVAM